MCKKQFLPLFLNDLVRGVGYEPAITVINNDLIQDRKSFCEEREVRVPTKVARLPNLHTRVKLHKEFVGVRFVVGGTNAPFTFVSNGSPSLSRPSYHILTNGRLE